MAYCKKNKFKLLTAWLLSIAVTITGAMLLSARPAYAEVSGQYTPKAYSAVDQDGGLSVPGVGTEFYCEFRSSAHIFCWREATLSEGSTDGTEKEKSYWFDPKLSADAGHDVFVPDDNAKIEEFGVAHFPNSVSGDYSVVQISNGPRHNLTGEGGVQDNDVDTSNFKTPPDDDGICSLEMFKNKKDGGVSCDVGDDPIRTRSNVEYKSGFSNYQEIKKCDKGGLGFILCPIQNMFWDAIRLVTGWIGNLMDVNTSNFQNSAITGASAQLLTVANAFYAIIFLLIIFANSLSLNVDSYTLKKLVPRLVAAIVMSQFAFFITGAIIDVGNLLGRGIQVFFEQLSGASNNNPGAGLGVIGGIAILLSITLGIVILICVLIAMVVMMIRQAVLYILILVSPLAFAMNVLPNTKKLWDLWWNNLIKLVLMYPIVIAIISGSAFVGALMTQSQNALAIQIMGVMLPFLGFAMLPKTLKWSGGIMKATGGKFSDWSAGKAKGAYQKSAKEGNLASAKGKLMMGAGSQITRLPGIGSAVGGKTMMAGAKLEGAKAAAEKSKWESLSEDNLKTIHARSSGKVKVDAAKEMDRRRKEAVDKQSERVARGQAPDAALSKKIDSLQVARLTGGGDRSGYYYDPTTGAQTMEVTGTGAQEIATGFLIAFNKTGGAGGAPPAPPTGASNTPQPGVPSAQTVAVPSGATPVYVGTPGGRTNIPDLSGLNKTP